MGLTIIDGRVMGPYGREEALDLPVDSGAGNSLPPRGIRQSLGLLTTRDEKFVLAAGTVATGNPFSSSLQPMRRPWRG